MKHAPKHAMLIALDQGRLSTEGQRRALAHLERCELCRSAQTGLQRYTELSNAARELEVPNVDYDRMALALRQEARTQAKAAGRRTLGSALAVAAALALVVFGASRWATPATPPSIASDSSALPQHVANAPTAVANASSSSKAVVGTNAAPAAAAPLTNPALSEGALLRADAGELTVQLWEGTEAHLHRDTVARVELFRQHQVRLLIERGTITSQVAPLLGNDSFEIAVNDLVIAVRGTRFVVERSADGTAQVTLTEGKVDVTRGTTLVARLLAPARWSQDRDPSTDQTIDGELRSHNANAPIGEGSVAERPAAPPQRSRPAASEPGNAVAVPTALKHLFARATPLLRACHQQSLRLDPTTPNAVSLVLSIDAAGKVQAVEVKANTTVPDALASCIRNRVTGWHIPIPAGGGMVLDIPLSFATTR